MRGESLKDRIYAATTAEEVVMLSQMGQTSWYADASASTRRKWARAVKVRLAQLRDEQRPER